MAESIDLDILRELNPLLSKNALNVDDMSTTLKTEVGKQGEKTQKTEILLQKSQPGQSYGKKRKSSNFFSLTWCPGVHPSFELIPPVYLRVSYPCYCISQSLKEWLSLYGTLIPVLIWLECHALRAFTNSYFLTVQEGVHCQIIVRLLHPGLLKWPISPGPHMVSSLCTQGKRGEKEEGGHQGRGRLHLYSYKGTNTIMSTYTSQSLCKPSPHLPILSYYSLCIQCRDFGEGI